MSKWLRWAVVLLAATGLGWACARLECGAAPPRREDPFDPMAWARGE